MTSSSALGNGTGDGGDGTGPTKEEEELPLRPGVVDLEPPPLPPPPPKKWEDEDTDDAVEYDRGMRRPVRYEPAEDDDEVGGRLLPAENGELLRLDDADDDGLDDIPHGNRSFPPPHLPPARRRCAARRGAAGELDGESARRRRRDAAEEGKVSEGQRLHMALLQKRREATALRVFKARRQRDAEGGRRRLYYTCQPPRR